MTRIEENKSLSIHFTVVVKHCGFTQWLVDHNMIGEHREHVQIFYDKMGNVTSTDTTARKRFKVEIRDLKIFNNHKFYR